MQNNNRHGVIVIQKQNIPITILVYALMFVSNDTYLFGTNSVYRMTQIPWFLMMGFIIVTGFQILSVPRTVTQKKTFMYGFILISFFVLLALYHREYFQVTVVRLLCITSALLFVIRYEFKDFEEVFVKVMVFNAIMAISLESIAYIAPSIAKNLPYITNTADKKIVTIGFAGIIKDYLSSPLIRNNGIFWEPGVFQMFLNIALLFEMYGKSTYSVKRVVIIGLGILITFSTAGYIVFLWIMVSYYLSKRDHSLKTLLVLVGVLVLVILVFNSSAFNKYVFNKLTNDSSGSTISRKASVYMNIKMCLEHPIAGIGMRNVDNRLEQLSSLFFHNSTTHNTNTWLYQFATFGVFYGTIFTIGMLFFTKNISNSNFIRLIVFITIVLIYADENLRSSMLPYVIVFYGYKEFSKIHII